MKRHLLILAFAVMAVIGLSSAARADGPVTVGTNGGPTWLVQGANISWDPSTGTYRNASEYIDVISGHLNGGDDLSSQSAAYLYKTNVVNYLRDYNPRSRYKEQWITEFGWRSQSMGEDAQRRRIKNFLIELTGSGYRYLAGWKFTHGFIYLTEHAGTTQSIYYPNTHYPPHAPKKVVTYYLKPLGWPAIQQPGVPQE